MSRSESPRSFCGSKGSDFNVCRPGGAPAVPGDAGAPVAGAVVAAPAAVPADATRETAAPAAIQPSASRRVMGTPPWMTPSIGRPVSSARMAGTPRRRGVFRHHAQGGTVPVIGKRLADRYEIIEELGRGGMGVVYRA